MLFLHYINIYYKPWRFPLSSIVLVCIFTNFLCSVMASVGHYILVLQKGTKITFVPKPKATRLIIIYELTSTLTIHSATMQLSLLTELQTNL